MCSANGAIADCRILPSVISKYLPYCVTVDLVTGRRLSASQKETASGCVTRLADGDNERESAGAHNPSHEMLILVMDDANQHRGATKYGAILPPAVRLTDCYRPEMAEKTRRDE